MSSQQRTRKLGRQDKPRSERTRNARTKSALRCYECEGRGHFASQCPTRLNKLSNSKSLPGRRRQNERSRRSHFPPDEASNRQQPVGEKESSSRLSRHINVARSPGVPIFWNEDTPTIVAEIESRYRKLILDTGSTISILQPSISRRKVQTSRAEPFGATGDILDITGQQSVLFRLGECSFKHTFLVCPLPTEAAALIGADLITNIRAVLDFDRDMMLWSAGQPQPRKGKALTTMRRALTVFSKGQNGRSPKLNTLEDRRTDKQPPSSPDKEAQRDEARVWFVTATHNFTIEPRCRQIIDGRVEFGDLQDPPTLVCIEPACIPIEGILAARGLTRVQPKTPDLSRDTSLASRAADALRPGCAHVMVANFSDEALTVPKATVFGVSEEVSESLVGQINQIDENGAEKTKQYKTVNKALYRKFLAGKLGHLQEKERKVIEPVLLRYAHVFHDEETNDFKGTSLIEHGILTGDDGPIRRPPYRVPIRPKTGHAEPGTKDVRQGNR